MVVALVDVFVLRTVWIFLLFPTVRTLEFMYLLYPVSYVLFAAAYAVVSIVLWRKYKRSVGGESVGSSDTQAQSKRN
jgi:membrane protein implicated in regulation of membrane protease activity